MKGKIRQQYCQENCEYQESFHFPVFMEFLSQESEYRFITNKQSKHNPRMFN